MTDEERERRSAAVNARIDAFAFAVRDLAKQHEVEFVIAIEAADGPIRWMKDAANVAAPVAAIHATRLYVGARQRCDDWFAKETVRLRDSDATASIIASTLTATASAKPPRKRKTSK